MKEIKDPARLDKYLAQHSLEDIFHAPLRPHLHLYAFEPGEALCSQGESTDALHVLVKGKIKIYTTSPEGKTLVISFKNPPDMVGDIEYVRDLDIINTVEAVSPVTVIGISGTAVKRYGDDHAPLLKFMLDVITKKFYIKSDFLSFNLMYPVEVRLASYLLSVCYDESDEGFEGRLAISQLTDTANLIGTSYRHLNRVIRRLSEEGMVERGGGYLHVRDRDRLSRLAGRNLYEH
ncbi:Crp/Fnr family transcriptional regulator [Saccharibacillus sp. CPCC 101409]|uniref:Crp/Fnr family transcriptional regulator n=1 Tax=Saccharibacillus sp. CPCC 101409 TaxID=3058041 RepID=UPI0026712F2D|nr:Crp/Fnr family transcriptional regulator [Saccharibacillus sp. CPCC 101409]MDO3412298.1 Crp/Fnr family transcriptional regulator [Saccharibacillus sp. CPCC 101409]